MHILITAGGTREYIDPVRFISNASSGKMGCALARAAIKAGHEVTLITAPMTQCPPDRAMVVNVETTTEMFEAVKKYFTRCDCLIMAAAVADYTPVRSATSKLKKNDQPLTIKLKPTPDILKWAGKNKKVNRNREEGKRKIVVGFALEDKAVRARAEKKLREKNIDMIVANSPAAIGTERSDVHIRTADSEWIKLEDSTKAATARTIVRLAEKLYAM